MWLDIINNSSKLVVFLYTKDKCSEKEIRETTPLKTATNNIKYLVITLTKQVKDLYDKNFKFLKKEIADDVIRWNDVPCSWIGRLNMGKKEIIPKAIYVITNKIPIQFFTDLERAIPNFIWKYKKPKVGKNNPV